MTEEVVAVGSQLPKGVSPGLRPLVSSGEIVRYVPIAGTHGWRDAWWSSDKSPFALMMANNGFSVIRTRDGRSFRWSTDLNGLKFWARNSDWEAGADALFYFLENVAYRDRNLIAHSHGGQVALLAASQGLKIRTLTTVGTPIRADIPVDDARRNVGLWQHIYDKHRDWFALLGQMGDREIILRRSFRLSGVLNFPLVGIRHTGVLRDETLLSLWAVNGWLTNIRNSPPHTSPPVAA